MRFLSLAAAAGIAVLASGPLAAQAPEPPPVASEPPAQQPAPESGQQLTQEPAAPDVSARYAFSRVDGGFLRFDSVSGQVALCSQRGAGWVCQAVPEDRAALDSEIARLQGEVTQLKSEVATLRAPPEPPRPSAELAPRNDGPKSGGLKLPTDEDIKWARAAIENIWRQFVDMVAELQKDLQRKG